MKRNNAPSNTKAQWADDSDSDGILLSDESEETEVEDDVLWKEGSLQNDLEMICREMETLTVSLKRMSSLTQAVSEGKEKARQQLRKERNETRDLCNKIDGDLRQLSRGGESRKRAAQLGDKHIQKKLHKVQETFQQLRDRVERMERNSRNLVASVSLSASICEDYEGQQAMASHQQQQAFASAPFLDDDGMFGSEKQELDRLEREMLQVKELFLQVNALVKEQQPYFDKIESDSREAEADQRSAVGELALATSYSAYSLPLIGAAVGGIVLGPLGAVAGAKGALALGACVFSGMGVGAWAGTKMKEKQQDDADLIIQHLADKQQ